MVHLLVHLLVQLVRFILSSVHLVCLVHLGWFILSRSVHQSVGSSCAFGSSVGLVHLTVHLVAFGSSLWFGCVLFISLGFILSLSFSFSVAPSFSACIVVSHFIHICCPPPPLHASSALLLAALKSLNTSFTSIPLYPDHSRCYMNRRPLPSSLFWFGSAVSTEDYEDRAWKNGEKLHVFKY